jgi:hypothetical protein
MRGPIRSILLAALAVCAFAALTVGQASGAVMRIKGSTSGFVAIYGSPGSNTTTLPVGGGLGRNFGFGENMLFEAGPTSPEENVEITLLGKVAKSEEAFFGGTLMSNKSGKGNPVSFSIQFSDFQKNTLAGTADPSYSDTSDRPWITEICSPEAAAKECKTDAQFEGPVEKAGETGGVKIENVSFNIGPGVVVQGTVWGKWINGTSEKPPCIELKLPAAGVPTLVDTQGGEVGKIIETIKGKACLVSANNDYYTGHHEIIELANTE